MPDSAPGAFRPDPSDATFDMEIREVFALRNGTVALLGDIGVGEPSKMDDFVVLAGDRVLWPEPTKGKPMTGGGGAIPERAAMWFLYLAPEDVRPGDRLLAFAPNTFDSDEKAAGKLAGMAQSRRGVTLDPVTIHRVIEQIRGEDYLGAIKTLRDRFESQLTLKDAKLMVDSMNRSLGIQWERTGRCFIATAAYGTPHAPAVRALRAYRDRVLQENAPGRALMRTYEKLSPPLAQVVARSPVLRWLVRACVVAPVARVVRRRCLREP